MSRFGFGVAALLVLATAACGDTAARGQLTVTGDSVVAIMNKSFGGEVISADCASSFLGTVEGSDDTFVTLRGGRIDYLWEDSRDTVTSYEWTSQTVTQLWGDSIIRAGAPRQSQQHGFGQSVPGREVRASVRFKYTRGADGDTLETEPYSFVCRNL